MKSTDKPNPPPPTSPTTSIYTTPGSPGSPSLRPTFESIKPSPSRSSSSQTLPSTRRSSRVSSTSTSAVEPIREKEWQHKKERTLTDKITHGAGKALGAVCHVLFLCCVLDGEKPGKTRPKRTRTNSSISSRHIAEASRLRKSSHASSRASSERIERA
jgi:hypothetical protein